MTFMKIFHHLDLGCPVLKEPFSPTTTIHPPANCGTTTAPCMWTNEFKNQLTSHSSWLRVLFFDLAYKQCNGIIKGWLHCLTPESIGRLLVNNILMFNSTSCLAMAQIHLSLIKRIKIGRPILIYQPLHFIILSSLHKKNYLLMCSLTRVLLKKSSWQYVKNAFDLAEERPCL